MKRTKRICRGALALFLMLGMLAAFGVSASAAGESGGTPVVSYGLSVLAARMNVAVSAPIGNEVVFSEDLIARSLNLSRVDFITVHTLPTAAEGELLLGSVRVVAGERISGENLAHMRFVAASEDVRHAAFTLSANGSATPTVCDVYLLDGINYTPDVRALPALTLNVLGYRDLCSYGRLSANDPEGDPLTFEIVRYPKNGTVHMEDAAVGSYVYSPAAGFVGSDRFSYVARDRYGNYSAAATVTVNVSLPTIGITYADMENSPAHNAAIALTEAGIMSGRRIGEYSYFAPEEHVTRAAFLVMAMNAAGITDVPACTDTFFADDGEIDPGMKGYVAAAYRMGYVSGSTVQGELCFYPNEAITNAEAALILSNVLGMEAQDATPTFSDGEEIPAWASEAIFSLRAVGILDEREPSAAPNAYATRESTARLLCNTLQYLK